MTPCARKTRQHSGLTCSVENLALPKDHDVEGQRPQDEFPALRPAVSRSKRGAELCQLYARAARVFGLAVETRAAIKSGDPGKEATAASKLEAELPDWNSGGSLWKRYIEAVEDYRLSLAAWYHQGQIGDRPVKPERSSSLPNQAEAQYVLQIMGTLHYRVFDSIPEARRLDHSLSTETVKFDNSFKLFTETLIKLDEALDDLRNLIDGENDGPINRNQVAKLVNLDKDTLKNNPEWLPRPIERGPNNVPVYQYRDVVKALQEKRPDLAILFPSYKEALEKLAELSTK